MFGKIFESLYTGSMVGAGPVAFALWPYVIANAKPPGVVELNPKLLVVIIGCTEDEVVRTIDYFCSPDPHSRTQEHEGRRIKAGSFAYEVPTWEKYREIRNSETRREQTAAAMRRYREKKKQEQ